MLRNRPSVPNPQQLSYHLQGHLSEGVFRVIRCSCCFWGLLLLRLLFLLPLFSCRPSWCFRAGTIQSTVKSGVEFSLNSSDIPSFFILNTPRSTPPQPLCHLPHSCFQHHPQHPLYSLQLRPQQCCLMLYQPSALYNFPRITHLPYCHMHSIFQTNPCVRVGIQHHLYQMHERMCLYNFHLASRMPLPSKSMSYFQDPKEVS